MLNIGDIAETVQTNCHISDARYAGNYSLCSFLLKMREYYRWEHDIPLSRSLIKNEVGTWLSEREIFWETFENQPFHPISINERCIDPFDSHTINQTLIPQGYIYSSGLGLFSKPHFFLGKLQQVLHRNGISVYIADCEYARDLVAPPAMRIGNNIFIRTESLRRFVWEKIEEWRLKSDDNTPMGRAIQCYPLNENDEQLLDQMCVNELENVMQHEFGEVISGDLLGDKWPALFGACGRQTYEIQLRSIKDILADCTVTLPFILQKENTASLHFYMANFTGMRKELFPQLVILYKQWLDDGNFDAFSQAIEKAQQSWLQLARDIVNQHRTAPDTLPGYIESVLSAHQTQHMHHTMES